MPLNAAQRRSLLWLCAAAAIALLLWLPGPVSMPLLVAAVFGSRLNTA